jgi:hypothetical protein
MTSKWTLDTGSMQENFFSDAVLIGIVCPLPPYRFSWLINNTFDLNFTRESELDICVQPAPDRQIFFPIYQYYIPLSGGRYLIYKLKNGKDFLLQELRQLDYLWMIQSHNADKDAESIIQELRHINDLQLAQIIPLDRLKNKDNLLI